MSDTLVRVENVSKKFCRDLKRSLWYGLTDLGSELLGREHGANGELRPGEFWAVKDVSFELKRGECLGLIGRNGAGKTTLLRMLNGLIKPDGGRVEIHGNVGALIALGAGFNPILSGRENIYVNASVLGLRKREIERNIDEIIDFAELGDAIDMPVQSYSSGMSVRLGFAISTTFVPDVLLLDEVLAVGDAAFRHKCYHRIHKVMSSSAVVFVSHSMDYVAHLSTAVTMMRRGSAEIYEDVIKGVAAYDRDTSASDSVAEACGRVEAVYPPVCSAKVRTPLSAVYGGRLQIEVEIDCAEEVSDVVFSFTAVNLSEQPVMCWHTSRDSRQFDLCAGIQMLTFNIEPLLLNNGDYYWNFNVTRKGAIEHLVWFMRAGRFTVSSEFRTIGNIPYLPLTEDCRLAMVRRYPSDVGGLDHRESLPSAPQQQTVEDRL
jgi:lipopolysaccharide transport system ATP-binding protein